MSTFHLVVALCLGLPLLANGSPRECMTTVEGYTWEYDVNTDELILEVDTVDLCYKACADDTECQGYTWTNAGVVPTCYKFKHQLLGYHECVACTSGVISQSVDGACSAEYDDILDVGPANNVEECRLLCTKKEGCQAYTWWDNTTFINTCFLYGSCANQVECRGCVSGRINCIFPGPDQCVNYMVLDKADRSVNNEGCGHNATDEYECYCDYIGGVVTSPDWKGPGQYRIISSAGSRLPESSPGYYHCGTNGSGWLRGEHPQDIYAEKKLTVCFHYDSNDCFDEADITVTNCDGYFVYLLPDTPYCYFRYCVTQ